VWKRTWFIKRLVEENKQKSERRKLEEAARNIQPTNNSARRLFNRQ
tara:strand:+ start:1633 stop:1770 length:138 start_codon:yes stop_codon:yes gene_type:complete